MPQEERVLGINPTGQYLCGQVVGRHMAATGGGSIINTSPQFGEGTGHPNMAHYLGSKGDSRGRLFVTVSRHAFSSPLLVTFFGIIRVYLRVSAAQLFMVFSAFIGGSKLSSPE